MLRDRLTKIFQGMHQNGTPWLYLCIEKNMWCNLIIEKKWKKGKMEKWKNGNEYEYNILTVFDEDDCGWDYPIDVLLDNGLGDRSKEEKISYLNDIIKDIEHYRDHLE